MLTYQQAAALFARARSQHYGRKLENNTRLVKVGDDYAVVLHATAVVTIHADGSYTLRSGCWRTVTTKRRINDYSPVRIWQRDFVWFMPDGSEFYDGVRVDACGRVLQGKAA